MEKNGNEKTELKLQKKYTLSSNWNAYDPFFDKPVVQPWTGNRLEKGQWEESIFLCGNVGMQQATAGAGKQTTQYLKLQLLRRRSAVKISKADTVLKYTTHMLSGK